MLISGFRIERQIGRGGMATVYLAIQESLGRPVVLKVMNTTLVDSPEFAKRFLKEGHMLATVNHPNVITIYDIGIAEDQIYISMEYLEGGDLGRRIDRGISPATALAIVRQVACALAAAHARGIVHRDVKPANILFRADGTPVLTDFGIAKHLGDTELTSTGTILGSPYYMSPEQADGRTALDGRSDIYSLGAIFFEMLTGTRPYEGDSAISIVLQHMQAPVPTLPREHAGFQPLLNRMLAKRRDDRFPDADSLVQYVRGLESPPQADARILVQGERGTSGLAGTPQPYQPGQITQRVQAARRRRRLWYRLVAVFAAVGAALGAYFVSEMQRYGQAVARPALTAGAGLEAIPLQPPPDHLLNPSAPRPAAAEDPFRLQVVTALKWLGRRSLEEERLVSPPEDNAYYYFTRLLELEPGNTQAVQGIGQIADRLARLAEERIRDKSWAEAESYISAGLQIDPENKRLLVLRSNLQLREKSFLDSLLGMFRGGG
jgi:tRNA A-37 threonylcarbamoyl transferase component Bud32